jgi:hypothetical protein
LLAEPAPNVLFELEIVSTPARMRFRRPHRMTTCETLATTKPRRKQQNCRFRTRRLKRMP